MQKLLRKKMKPNITLPALFFVAALFITGCSSGTPSPVQAAAQPPVTDTRIIAEGRVEPIRYVDLALNTSGLVSEVLIAEGNQVKAGDIIARLENSQTQTLESARADSTQGLAEAYKVVRDAQYELDNFDVPSDFTGLTPPQAVEAMLEKLNAARDAFEPYEDLDDRILEPTNSEEESGVYRNTAKLYKKRLDDAWADYRKAIRWLELETDLEVAKANLDQVRKDYDQLQDPSFAEDTAGTRAALANAEVRAPFEGTITNLDLKVGEFAPAGQAVVTIADPSSWLVKTTDLTEIDVVDIKEGQPVQVTLDAIPGITLKGNVLSIGQNYYENQGDIVYEVIVLLTDRDPAMRWGMTAEVKFDQ